MHLRCLARLVPAVLVLLACADAQERRPVQLPAPRTEGGKPLMQALKERKTSRSFDKKELPLQVLSDLLWAAFGVNRPGSGHRTAPSAHNLQEIDIYVALPDGIFLYAAKENRLDPVLQEDVRALAGTQDFVRDAPLNLIYVADFSKLGDGPESEKILYTAADTGFIGQNVYLFCASEGLATVIRGGIDRPSLAKRIGLGPGQRIILAQTVGYPK